MKPTSGGRREERYLMKTGLEKAGGWENDVDKILI